jgi:hypothetical protein
LSTICPKCNRPAFLWAGDFCDACYDRDANGIDDRNEQKGSKTSDRNQLFAIEEKGFNLVNFQPFFRRVSVPNPRVKRFEIVSAVKQERAIDGMNRLGDKVCIQSLITLKNHAIRLSQWPAEKKVMRGDGSGALA